MFRYENRLLFLFTALAIVAAFWLIVIGVRLETLGYVVSP